MVPSMFGLLSPLRSQVFKPADIRLSQFRGNISCSSQRRYATYDPGIFVSDWAEETSTPTITYDRAWGRSLETPEVSMSGSVWSQVQPNTNEIFWTTMYYTVLGSEQLYIRLISDWVSNRKGYPPMFNLCTRTGWNINWGKSITADIIKKRKS